MNGNFIFEIETRVEKPSIEEFLRDVQIVAHPKLNDAGKELAEAHGIEKLLHEIYFEVALNGINPRGKNEYKITPLSNSWMNGIISYNFAESVNVSETSLEDATLQFDMSTDLLFAYQLNL